MTVLTGFRVLSSSEMYSHNFCDSYTSFAHWKIIWHVLESFCTLRMIFCFTHNSKENLTKFIYIWSYGKEFPGGANGKEPSSQCRRHKSCGFNLWVRKIPWRKPRQPTPVFLPGESPWAEEPGRLQSIGSQRVRQSWSNWACMHEAIRQSVTNSISKW